MPIIDTPERPAGAIAGSWQFLNWLDQLYRRVVTDTIFKAGSFTVDMTSASGDQAVDGVGFPPKALIVGGSNLGARNSIGVSDGTSSFCIYDDSNVTADNWGFTNALAYFEGGGGDTYTLQVASLDPDGFTLSKTKGGAASGSAFCWYLALR